MAFKQLVQERPVVDFFHQQHVLRALIGRFERRVRHHALRGGGYLHEKPVVVDAADDLSLIVDDVLAHHHFVGNAA